MVWMFLLCFFAAFGVFSALLVLAGVLLSPCGEGWLLYPGRSGKSLFVEIYLWLRGVGLVTCPLILADFGLSELEKKQYWEQGIEICGLAELPRRLGIGANTN